MPETSLKSLHHEAEQKGATLVLRGLQTGSFKETAERLKVLEIAAEINPPLFEEFGVTEVPTFVWALGGGVVIRNVLDYVFGFKVFDRAIDVFGNASLSIYLAIALLSLKLWELTDLAGPLMIILAAQTLMLALYAAFITFRVMGKNYDAAVLAAGHCGFGMGATPTAVANMQAITNQYGPSHKAFLIVPLVGAFFIDIINAFVLQGFISLLR